MKLLSLELSGVGRFAHKSVDLSGTIVGVVGPNGSGKTTILGGAYYALTGDLSRLGRADGAVSLYRTDPAARPYARLTLSPSGRTGDVAVVTRWLPEGKTRGKRRLVHADRMSDVDEDVNSEVEKWLGLPLRSAGEFVFVAQGRMSDIVEDQPARRADTLQRLFNVGVAEKARDVLVDALSDLPSPPDRTVIAASRARAAELDTALADAERRLGEVPYFPDDLVSAAAGLVESSRRRATLFPSLRDAESRVRRLEMAAEAELPPVPPRAEEIIAAAAEWSRYRREEENHTRNTRKYESAVENLKAMGDPPDVGTRPERADRTRLGLWEAVAACNPGDKCPVCSQTTDKPIDTSAAEAEVSRIKEEVLAADKSIADWDARYAARERWERKANELRTRAEAFKPGEPPVPPGVPEPPEHELLRVQVASAARAEAEGSRSAAKAELIQARANLLSIRSRMPPAIEPKDLADAERVVTESGAASRARERAAGEVSATAAAARANAAVVAAAVAAEEAAAASSWRADILRSAAAILHRDAAPASVVRGKLYEMTGSVNQALVKLGADFDVVVGPSGDLTPRRGGRSVPRLSGAQNAILALAWRLVTSPRILCLDEPTYGLDGKRIDCLRSALESWRESRPTGQIIVVTHERRLLGAFDKVVEL